MDQTHGRTRTPSLDADCPPLAGDARAPTPPEVQGTLSVWPDGILFVGEDVRSEPHHHYTASLFFALSGTLRIRVAPEPRWLATRGALVAPDVRQEMDARGCLLVNLQIDPETDEYGRVASRLAGPLYELPHAVVDELAARTRSMLSAPGYSPARVWDLALGLVGDLPGPRRRFDPRIQHVLDRLKRDVLSTPAAADLAEGAGLSEGRLLHLFSQEVGVPLRRYVLWLRLRQVVYAWALTRSLTEAAHAAGFADSAHLSRTFRSMYGMRPSNLFRSDGRVELVVGFPSGRLSGPHASHDGRLWANAAAALEDETSLQGVDERHRWLPLQVRGPRPCAHVA